MHATEVLHLSTLFVKVSLICLILLYMKALTEHYAKTKEKVHEDVPDFSLSRRILQTDISHSTCFFNEPPEDHPCRTQKVWYPNLSKNWSVGMRRSISH